MITNGFLSAHALIDAQGRYDGDGFDDRLKATYVPQVVTVESCPVCSHRNFSSLQLPRQLRVQEGIFLKIEGISQDLWRCENCGLVLSRRILPPDFYFEYLNTSYQNATYPDTQTWVADIEAHYRAKHRFIWSNFDRAPSGKILEISSFWGTGLDDLSAYCDVYGLEAETAAAKFSVDRYSRLNGRIINDVLENRLDQLVAIGPFDTVLLSYAFRQIAHPLIVLDGLRKMVKLGGLLIMAEGVWSDFIFHEPPEAVRLHFSHNKNFYYNSLNLCHLLASFGFAMHHRAFRGRDPQVQFDQSLVAFRRTEDIAYNDKWCSLARESEMEILSHYLAMTTRQSQAAV